MGQVRAQRLRDDGYAGLKLERAVVAFVTSGAEWATHAENALRSSGCTVLPCTADRQLWVTLTQERVDMVILADTGRTLGRAEVLMLLLEEPDTRHLPRLALLGPGETLTAALATASPVLTLAGSAPAELVRATCEALMRNAASSVEEEWNLARVRRLCEKLDTLAHDARTLMGVSMGFACNLRDGINGELTELQRDAVVHIVEASTDAVRLLDDDAWRAPSMESNPPLSGRAEERPRVLVDLSSLVRSMVRLFQEAAREQRITLEAAGEPGVHLWASTLELKQIILNLVSNAVKFTPKGGRVRVSVRATESGARNGMSECQLVVEDTGKGLSPEEQQRVFEYGTQFPKGAPTGSGRGVGLYVVKKLVASYKGRIDVQSTPERGTEITVRLPTDPRLVALAGQPQRSAEQSDVAPSSKVAELVRLLEDRDTNELLRRLLAEDPEVLANALQTARSVLPNKPK